MDHCREDDNDDSYQGRVLTEEDLDQLRTFVDGRNPKRLNALIQCKLSSTNDDNKRSFATMILRKSTPKSCGLLELCVNSLRRRRRECEKRNGRRRNGHREESPDNFDLSSLASSFLLRATLMINPWFETPWMLLDQLGSILLHVSPLEQLDYISSIQLFLNEEQQRQRIALNTIRRSIGGTGKEREEIREDETDTVDMDSDRNDCPVRGSAAYYLVQFSVKVMDDLLSVSSQPPPMQLVNERQDSTRRKQENDDEIERYALLYSGLFHSVCALVKSWEDRNSRNNSSALVDCIIRRMYLRRQDIGTLPSKTFLLWLMLVKEASSDWFSEHHQLKVSEILLERLSSKPTKKNNKTSQSQSQQRHCGRIDCVQISPIDAAAVISIILELWLCWMRKKSHQESDDDDSSNTSARNLVQAVVLATDVTSVDSKSYASAERLLHNFVYTTATSIPDLTNACNKYWKSILLDDRRNIPRWLAVNLLMILAKQNNAFDEGEASFLLDEIHQSEHEDSVEWTKGILKSLWDGCRDKSFADESIINLRYSWNGSFVDKEGRPNHVMSSLGSDILRCILNGNSDARQMRSANSSHAIRIYEARGVSFIEAAECVLRNENLDDDQMILATLIVVVASAVLFMECPSSRSRIVNRLRCYVTLEKECLQLYDSALTTVRTIAQSLVTNGGENDENNGGVSYEEELSFLLDGTLPVRVLIDLSKAFKDLPEARPDILWWSNQLLSPVFTVSGGEYNRIFSSSIKDEIKVGLASCLTLICSEAWDDIAKSAWRIISDLLVANHSPLDLETIRWIYHAIEDTFLSGQLGHAKPFDHIIRALTVRLSSYFESDGTIDLATGAFVANRPLHVENEKETQATYSDFVMLSRLLIRVFGSLVTHGDQSDRRALLLAEGREVLLRHTISVKKGDGNSCRHLARFLLRQQPPECDDTFSVCWHVFLLLQCCCLDSLVASPPETKTVRSAIPSPLLENVRQRIQMIKALELKTVDTSKNESVPFWLVAGNEKVYQDRSGTKEVTIDTPMSIKFSVIDNLLECFWIVPLPTRSSNNDIVDPLSRRIIPACGFLMSIRRRMSEFSESDSTDHSNVLNHIAGPFLAISSEVLQNALSQSFILPECNELITAATDFCYSLYEEYSTQEDLNQEDVIIYLWSLYQAIASEKAAIRLIAYLELHGEELDNAPQNTAFGGGILLKTMSGEADVDSIIHDIRLSILRTLNAVLDNFSMLVQRYIGAENVDTVEKSADLIWGILEALAKDLRSGLSGNSGGITYDMYVSFVLSIEACATILRHHDSCVTGINIDLLERASSVLAEILVSHSLDDAKLFRSTFLVVTSVLPSLWMSLMRRSLRSEWSLLENSSRRTNISSNLMSSALDDAIEILHRWGALREPHLVPWGDIAGPFHLLSDEDATKKDYTTSRDFNLVSFDDSAASALHEVPRVVHIRSPKRDRKEARPCDSPDKNSFRIRLNSKQTWSFALSCSLIAIEGVWQQSLLWMESEELYQAEQSQIDDMSIISRAPSFFQQRTNKLSTSLSQVNRFFQPFLASPHVATRDASSGHPLGVLAMILPSAPRSRLCISVEKITQTLNCAISCLHSYLSGDSDDVVQSLVLLEAMCCLGAWLKNWDEGAVFKEIGDFSVGVVRLHSVVSRKPPPDESSQSQTSHRKEMMERVSTTLQFVQYMYQNIQKLHAKLQRCLINNMRDNRVIQLSTLADVVGLTESGGGDPDDNQLLRLLERKVNSLKRSVPEHMDRLPLPDFPVPGNYQPSKRRAPKTSNKNSSSVSPHQLSGKRKRKRNSNSNKSRNTQQHGQNGRNAETTTTTNALGNRNKVVGMFYELDQKQDGKKGRRSTRYDAYADLEDFLVEG